MIPTVIKVYLNDDESSVVEVPLTPNTTADDVVDFCKVPGEKECRLLERWRGKDRIVDANEKIYNILQQWGTNAPEINFILFRDLSDKVNNYQQSFDDRNSSKYNIDEINSVTKLKEIAGNQHQQIERQEKAMIEKDQRLKFLKEQMQHRQVMIGENEKVRRLKEKAEAQEAKLKKIRMLCGKAENNKQKNLGVNNELEAVKRLFEQKQVELAAYMQKVTTLSSELQDLRRGNLTPNLLNGLSMSFDYQGKNGADSPHNIEGVETNRREVAALKQINLEEHSRLDKNQNRFRKRSEDVEELRRRIELLSARVSHKKQSDSNHQRDNDTQIHSPANPNQPVASVGPFFKPNQQQLRTSSHNENEVLERFNQQPPTSDHISTKVSRNPRTPFIQNGNPPQQSFKYLPLQQQTKSSRGPAPNIFVYKDPPSSNHLHPSASVLSNGNIQYKQTGSPYPPPYLNQYGSQVDSLLTDLRKKYSKAPRPLKKRSSITEVERPQGPNIPKNLYDKIYKQADTPYYRTLNETSMSKPPPAYKEPVSNVMKPVPEEQLKKNDNPAISYESNVSPRDFVKQISKPSSISPKTINKVDKNDTQDQNQITDDVEAVDVADDASDVAPTKITLSNDTSPAIKGILKKPTSVSKKRNIRFDPLALLLDASLIGDFELVKKVVSEVSNPSGANDEGITALHNAVCAGHTELVRFLVHHGSDVNAADTDGWTPLHCAASCNNYPMAKFLVENGACIFATTMSDDETATDKCEEQDEGFEICFNYLREVQDKLGHVRHGQVYGLFDYKAENEDELSFSDGDLLTIVRRGDDIEEKWWFARLNGQSGYIPQNFIGLWPRIKAKD